MNRGEGVTRAWRVLLTLPDLGVGGGQVGALQAIQHLDRERFEVGVLALYPDRSVLDDEFRALGVEPVVLPHHPGRSFAEAPAVARLLRERRIDLVQIAGPDERRLLIYASMLARVPVVQHLHSEFVHLRYVPNGGNWARRNIRRALAATRNRIEQRVTREYLADSPAGVDRFGPYLRRPVHVMSQAMPLSDFDRAAAEHDDAAWRAGLGIGPGQVVVNVSRMVEGKGQERVLAAFAQVAARNPDVWLLLVGDGEHRTAHERSAIELGVGDRVRFVGWRRDIPWVLAGADVFAFGSRTESFGLVVAEAMAARLPVVAYELPALSTFCAHGVTGFFPGQSEEGRFAAHIETLLGDAAMRARFGAAGRQAIEARFPERAAADSFEAAWERVLEPAAAPHRARAKSRNGTARVPA